MIGGGLHTLSWAEVRRKPCRVGQKARPRSKTRIFKIKEQEVRIGARWQAARSWCIRGLQHAPTTCEDVWFKRIRQKTHVKTVDVNIFLQTALTLCI